MAHKKLAVLLITAAIQKANVFGVKRFAANLFFAGNIIVRQRGYVPRWQQTLASVKTTLFFALTEGKVKFAVKGPKNRKFVSIEAE